MSGSFFFGGMDLILGSRTARQRERAAITIYRVLQARNECATQAVGGGSADTPAPVRTPRRTLTSSRKPASGDEGDSEGEPERRWHSHIPGERLLRLPQVLETVGLGKTLLYELMKTGEFPQPRKVRHLSLWPESEIQQWVRTVAEPKKVG